MSITVATKGICVHGHYGCGRDLLTLTEYEMMLTEYEMMWPEVWFDLLRTRDCTGSCAISKTYGEMVWQSDIGWKRSRMSS